MNARALGVMALSLGTALGLRAQTDAGELLLLSRQALDSARARSAWSAAAVRTVIADADKAISAPLVTVVRKQQLPPSGDPHDYLSLAPYWWPDPSRPDGLPYIRRDGETNPEYNTVGDHRMMMEMIARVRTLALAYTVTEDERYAEPAIRQLSVWFVDDSTRMNPNLNYAQAIKGVNEGRGIGIIETYGFRYLIDAFTLLETSKHWTPELRRGIAAWFAAYLMWLQESPNGKDEAGWKNNHGSAYDVQASCIAFYLGKVEIARKILGEVGTKRIAVQVEPDGSQPLELERTKSWDYSVMNLDALIELAILGDRVGLDLWNTSTADGRGIRRAIDYLLPYATGKSRWTQTQIVPFKPERLHYALSWGALRYHEPSFAGAAATLATDSLRSSWEIFRLPPSP